MTDQERELAERVVLEFCAQYAEAVAHEITLCQSEADQYHHGRAAGCNEVAAGLRSFIKMGVPTPLTQGAWYQAQNKALQPPDDLGE